METLAATKSGSMIGDVVVIEKSIPVNSSGKVLTDEEMLRLPSSPQIKNILSKKYVNCSTTPLKAKVKKGKNMFPFELTRLEIRVRDRLIAFENSIFHGVVVLENLVSHHNKIEKSSVISVIIPHFSLQSGNVK